MTTDTLLTPGMICRRIPSWTQPKWKNRQYIYDCYFNPLGLVYYQREITDSLPFFYTHTSMHTHTILLSAYFHIWRRECYKMSRPHFSILCVSLILLPFLLYFYWAYEYLTNTNLLHSGIKLASKHDVYWNTNYYFIETFIYTST